MEQLWQSGWELPAGVEWVSMSCGSAIDELHIMRAFEAGAEKVLILSCFEGACRSLEGSRWVSRRVKAVHSLLQEIGISPGRLVHQNISPNMGADLRTWIEQQGKDVEELNEQWYSENYWQDRLGSFKAWDKLIKGFNEQVGLIDKYK